MSIWITSLAQAPRMAERLKPSRIVSLLSPYDTFPVFAGLASDRHLQVAIHDISQDVGDWRAPGEEDVEKLVRFVEPWDRAQPMLIHCWAGISRSTASAFISACLHNPSTDEEEIAWAIRDASPTAYPNPRLVGHADALLGRGGRMSKAVAAIGRGTVADEAIAFSHPFDLEWAGNRQDEMTTPIAVGLSAVIVAADAEAPYALATRHADGAIGLPHGRFDPQGHRTFELGLREWVRAQTGFEPGYVEQLYTFGDRGRELPQAELGDAPSDARLISVGYLGLTPERTDISAFNAVWRDWHSSFPWEDHRKGRPEIIDAAIAPALASWADQGGRETKTRLSRVQLAFGLEDRPWIEERTLERYELLYEAGLAPEAARDRGQKAPKLATATHSKVAMGEPMISDHRRILATAIGRLRGKIKYRPVVFELMPERFTLLDLQKVVEAILGRPLHKQNFRRALDRSGLVEGLGSFTQAAGGRPAELFRFRREALREGNISGVQTPRA